MHLYDPGTAGESGELEHLPAVVIELQLLREIMPRIRNAEKRNRPADVRESVFHHAH